MKTSNKQSIIFTRVLAASLKEWRIANGLSVYAIAKAIGAHQNTIARLEQGEGGISLETGLRYIEFIESHPSRPAFMRSLHLEFTKFKDPEVQRLYLEDCEKAKASAQKKSEDERRRQEDRLRSAITAELSVAYEQKLQVLTEEKNHLLQRINELNSLHEREKENAIQKAIEDYGKKRKAQSFAAKTKRWFLGK